MGARAGSRRALGWIDLATLTGVVTVVVLVSVPRLEVLARTDNQLDAIAVVRVLAKLPPASSDAPDGQGGQGPLGGLGALVAADPRLTKQLEDVEPLAGGRLLRCHGYLFDRMRTAEGDTVLRAWPWAWGRTGSVALVVDAEGRLLCHPNEEGRWQGPDHPPTGPWTAPWKELDGPLSRAAW